MAVGKAFGKQRLKGVPLHAGGVLELVEQDVVEFGSGLFIDEGSVGAVEQALEQGVGVGKQKAVVLSVLFADFGGDVGEQADLVEVLAGHAGGKNLGIELYSQPFGFFKERI